ncbi:MAG: hypothetical protein ACJ71H_10910 [Nitrososphaeraceae archaeon]
MKAFAIDDNDKNPTSSSNNENPSKTKKIITVKDENGNKVKVRPLKSNCKGTNIDCAQAAEIVNYKPQHHNKIKEMYN